MATDHEQAFLYWIILKAMKMESSTRKKALSGAIISTVCITQISPKLLDLPPMHCHLCRPQGMNVFIMALLLGNMNQHLKCFLQKAGSKIPRQSNQEDLGTILLSMMPLKWQTQYPVQDNNGLVHL